MDDTGHEQLISKLFALITMKCEDGAAQAILGQGRETDSGKLADLASHLQSLGEEIGVIAEATSALLQRRN